jgi:hypothetical protein
MARRQHGAREEPNAAVLSRAIVRFFAYGCECIALWYSFGRTNEGAVLTQSWVIGALSIRPHLAIVTVSLLTEVWF